MTADKPQTTTNESFQRFFEYIYKTLFSKRTQFSKCSYEKGGFSLKEESLGFDVYSSDGNSSRQ